MTTLTLDTGRRDGRSLLDKLVEEREERAPAPRAAQPATSPASGATLDALVARSWSSLRVARAAACLLCGGEVAPRYGSGPHPVGGTCRDCATEIS